MKIGQFLFIAFFSSTIMGYSQLRFVNSINHLIATNSSAFLDASSNPNYNRQPNLGKGLLFPRTDLTQFTAFGGAPIGIASSYPSYYDGLLVYNSASSGVVGVGSTSGQLISGFYYYDNSSSVAGKGSVNAGIWKRLGASNVVNNSEEATDLTIDSFNVYSYKGAFTADGTNTLISLSDLPEAIASGITSLYRITIYNKDKNLFTNTVYSFDATNRQIVTGSPNVSVVYESGTYNYILEYLK